MNKITIKSTPFGSVVIIWVLSNAGPRVFRVLLSKPSLSAEAATVEFYSDVSENSCEEINTHARNMLRLLDGEPVKFSLDIAALFICGEFQQRVLRAEHAIPRGQISTYKLIAAHLGVPKGARAVGNALANNPFPLIVPCHRAIRSDMTLGGYQGGLEMKQLLLEKEGIVINKNGKVESAHFYYEN